MKESKNVDPNRIFHRLTMGLINMNPKIFMRLMPPISADHDFHGYFKQDLNPGKSTLPAANYGLEFSLGQGTVIWNLIDGKSLCGFGTRLRSRHCGFEFR